MPERARTVPTALGMDGSTTSNEAQAVPAAMPSRAWRARGHGASGGIEQEAQLRIANRPPCPSCWARCDHRPSLPKSHPTPQENTP